MVDFVPSTTQLLEPRPPIPVLGSHGLTSRSNAWIMGSILPEFAPGTVTGALAG